MRKIIEAVRADEYKHQDLKEHKILDWFYLCDACWVHSGDSNRPHAELTSGKCSNGFFDCLRILRYPNFNEILAHQLAHKLHKAGVRKGDVDWVIGSSYAAITFSYEVARILGAVHGFTEKDTEAPKRMVWKRMEIPKEARVLQIEELIATSRTFQSVRQAIERDNPNKVEFFPQVGVLVHRPPKLPVDYKDREVVAVIEREVWAVEQSECPLCKAGSRRLRPKTHWKELTRD